MRDFSRLAFDAIQHTMDDNAQDTALADDLSQVALAYQELVGRRVDMSLLVGGVRDFDSELAGGHTKSKNELKQIWHDVHMVDRAAAGAIAMLKDEVAAAVAEYAALVALLQPVDGRIPLQDMSADGLREYLMGNCPNNEQAYDRRLQEAVLSLLDDPEFSQEVWDSLDEQGRQDFLERLLARVQGLMGTQINPEIVFAAQDHPKGWLGNYDPDKNQIVLYPVLFDKDRDFIMRSIFHEARHGYQAEAILDGDVIDWINRGGTGIYRNYHGNRFVEIDVSNGFTPRHPYVSQETVDAWTRNSKSYIYSPPRSFEEYVQQPREFDAWSFAGELEPDVFAGFYPDTDVLYNLHPPYPGSWHVPQR
jgi:hypothetical protein